MCGAGLYREAAGGAAGHRCRSMGLTGSRTHRPSTREGKAWKSLQLEIETLGKLHETRASKNISCAGYWLKQDGCFGCWAPQWNQLGSHQLWQMLSLPIVVCRGARGGPDAPKSEEIWTQRFSADGRVRNSHQHQWRGFGVKIG